ncbi:protein AAR2 homolog [Nomia melanderi]|uniref:protein AAR2 homolog n=1 Tax=Nomia melanderi TaxID=2448451 RepID=UPI001304157E|nr:protein AAR2 homolog [Nomia melanderi]XP_031826901.1 protein AAR2 homolog [Nomia melanderi]XP_031826903.1 protein AAR2 homolog [Nomia melanderi]
MASGKMKIDEDFIGKLVDEAAKVVVLNIPSGTEFGIDLKTWRVTDSFMGIRMIPPGFHYVHYSAVNRIGEPAPRIGFFHTFSISEFLVKKWDEEAEDFSVEAVPEEVVQRLKSNSKQLDRYLACYPFDIWIKWIDLTNLIRPSLAERCAPVCGVVRSALELEHCTDAMRPRGGVLSPRRKKRCGITVEERENELLPDMKPVPGTDLRFTKLPTKYYPDNASPSEITMHSLDSSYALETFLRQLPHPLEIIGEMQLAFVCFLVGQSLDSFDHWKKLIILICDADSAIPKLRGIYIAFLKAIETQLTHVPDDILCDIVDNNNFIYHSLRKLFATIEENSRIDSRLKCQASHFRDRLKAKLAWDFSDMHEVNEDEAPVIVSLD